MKDPVEEYFKSALRLQVLVHTGKFVCHNCQDVIDDDHEKFCGMCREVGCGEDVGGLPK